MQKKGETERVTHIFLTDGRKKCKLYLMKIIYFDTETTGLTPGKICQLSYVLEEDGAVQGKNMFFAVPFVEPSAQQVHGFSVEKLATLSGGQRFCDRLDEIAFDFSTADLIVGHNVKFDIGFLTAEFSYEYETFRYQESLCSMRAFTPICKLPRATHVGYKYPKLSELLEFLEIYPYDVTRAELQLFQGAGGAHDARYDAAAVYLAIQKAKEKGLFQ